ncbi:MAG: hypothetical protein H7246_22860 [Phycisphaerae bacterium]|nr:hypothetical protein [Saprospiraceae bacterium]
MEQIEKALSPQESLRVIQNTIDLAKRSAQENGFHFLLWGWLIVIASIANWYLIMNPIYPQPSIVWMIMVVVGMPASLIREWLRAKKKEHSGNVIHKWYGLTWLGFGVSMVISMPFAQRSGLSPIPFILVLTGFATFMSGLLLNFRPLLFGAAVIWACGLWCLFLAPMQHLLMQAAAAAFGYLIPGYLLNHQTRTSDVPRP